MGISLTIASAILLLTVSSMIFTLPEASAASGDLLLEINNPTPEIADNFGRGTLASTPNGNIIVGALDNTGADNAGSVYLFDGNTGALLLTINNPTPEVNDRFGESFASTPNGNIIVGEPLDDIGGVSNAGSVYLFDVSTCDNAIGSTPDDNICEIPVLTINNPTPFLADHFGNSVASTPNGNIIVGAESDDTGVEHTGSVYLFDGTTGALLLTINNPTPEPAERFGWSVASTPDGNIIVGADQDNTVAADAGSAYLFDVSTCDNAIGSTPDDNICEIPVLTINNPIPGDGQFGNSVASTPNGNIIVGAFNDDTGASRAGSVYLFDGNTGALLLTINNPTPEVGGFFGGAVASTPNGNIIVGAGGDDTGALQAGSVYLFDGNTGALLLTINNPTPDGNDFFGGAVASTPNGDIIASTIGDDTGALGAGSAYLFLLELVPFDDGWQFRKQITINSAQVDSALTDFPVLVSITDSDLRDKAQNDGDDILFTESDGLTILPHEIEKYDGTTGELVAWVKVPSLSSNTDTELFMYYGNASAANQEDISGTWNSNYVGVYHLHDDFLDSTTNNNDGINDGSSDVSCLLGDCQSFDGVDDLISIADDATLDITSELTMSAWFKIDGASADNQYPRIISKGQSQSGNGAYSSFVRDSGTDGCYTRIISGGTHFTGNVLPCDDVNGGDWHYAVWRYSDSGDVSDGRMDGGLSIWSKTVSGSTLIDSTADDLHIGDGANERHFNGDIDEVRISNVYRNDAWFDAEYNNQKIGSIFLDIGAEETSGDTIPPTVGPITYVSNDEDQYVLDGETTNMNLLMHWSASDDTTAPQNLTLECTVNDVVQSDCDSGSGINFVLGLNVFQVRAIDEAGNISDPSTFTFTYDPDWRMTVTFTIEQFTTISDGTFTYNISGVTPDLTITTSGGFGTVSTLYQDKTGDLFGQMGVIGPPGWFIVDVDGCNGTQDGFGDDYVSFFSEWLHDGDIITCQITSSPPDSIPPVSTIDSSLDGNSIPLNDGDTTDSNQITISFSATDNVSLPQNITFECSLDTASFSACTSPQVYSSLADATHTFEVRATDEALNTESPPASFSWIVDTAPHPMGPFYSKSIQVLGLAGGNSIHMIPVQCDAGDIATGGGYSVTGASEVNVYFAGPIPIVPADGSRGTPTGYQASVNVPIENTFDLQVFVICADLTP